MLPVALLLFPALGYASIIINIKAAPQRHDTLVTHAGRDSRVISDLERTSLNLTDQALEEAISLNGGAKPLDVFVKRPTPWGDLYKTYDWPEVRRNTEVKRVNADVVKRENVTLAKKVYTNNLNEDVVFTANVKSPAVTKISNAFKGSKLSAHARINIDLDQGVMPLTHLDFVSHLQNNTVLNVVKTMQAVNEIEFNLKPSDAVEVVMNATKVTMRVLVDYETTLNGVVAANYKPRYKGHHFWGYDIRAMIKATGKPLVQNHFDFIEIEYFTNAKVVLVDVKTGRLIQSADAVYVD